MVGTYLLAIRLGELRKWNVNLHQAFFTKRQQFSFYSGNHYVILQSSTGHGDHNSMISSFLTFSCIIVRDSGPHGLMA